MAQSLAEDNDDVGNEIVAIAFDRGTFDLPRFDRKLDLAGIRYVMSHPLRIQGIHHLTDSKIMQMLWPLILFMLGKENRKRLVGHKNSQAAWLADFADYGLTTKELPVQMGGSLRFDLTAWLDDRRERGL